LLSNLGEPLKRIYKASQEKKENSSPGVPKVFVFHLAAPGSVFQKRTGLCNRTLKLLLFCLAFCVPVFTSVVVIQQ